MKSIEIVVEIATHQWELMSDLHIIILVERSLLTGLPRLQSLDVLLVLPQDLVHDADTALAQCQMLEHIRGRGLRRQKAGNRKRGWKCCCRPCNGRQLRPRTNQAAVALQTGTLRRAVSAPHLEAQR